MPLDFYVISKLNKVGSFIVVLLKKEAECGRAQVAARVRLFHKALYSISFHGEGIPWNPADNNYSDRNARSGVQNETLLQESGGNKTEAPFWG